MMNKLITTSKGIFAFVEIPFDATEVQTWNHGIGFKSEILKTDKDSNGFQHLCTGLFRWKIVKLLYQLEVFMLKI